MTKELLNALETIKNMPVTTPLTKRGSRTPVQYPYARDKGTGELFRLLAVDEDVAWVKTIGPFGTRIQASLDRLQLLTASGAEKFL